MHPCLNDSLWQLLLQPMHHLLQSFKQLDLTTEVAGLSRARKPAVDSSDSSSGGGGSGNRHASRLPDPHSLVSWVRAQSPDEGEGEQGLLPGLCILTERWMSEVCASRRMLAAALICISFVSMTCQAKFCSAAFHAMIVQPVWKLYKLVNYGSLSQQKVHGKACP